MPLRRLPLLAALALTAALTVAPTVAQADDAQMKAGIIPALQALAKKETAASQALRSVTRHGRSSVPSARRKVRAASSSAKVFAALLNAQQPSSAGGQQAKTLLLGALKLEASAYASADQALKSYKAGNTARANRILRGADKKIVRAVNDGRKAVEILATL